MKLPIEWPRRQQRANRMATANLGGFSHGQDQEAPILHSTEKIRVPQGTKGREEGDRVEVLSAAP